MATLAILRTLGALMVVLGLLGLALWSVKRFNLRLPGATGTSGTSLRRIEVVERLGLDGKRSIALIRRDGREHLLLLGPNGPLLIEGGIVLDERDHAAAADQAAELDSRKAAQAMALAGVQLRLQANAARLAEWLHRARRSGTTSFASLVEQARAKVPARPDAPPVITAAQLIALNYPSRKAS